MRVVTIGGGPAGLYFALLLKKAHAEHDVTVLERNAPGVTFGWGVVFSDQTLQNFQAADEDTYHTIVEHFAHWDDIDVIVGDRTITSGGHGFSGIARRTLLDILHRRAVSLGVDVRFNCNVASIEALDSIRACNNADLIVAADGVNSSIRHERAAVFKPHLDVRPAHFVWFGTTRPFDAFTFFFVQNELGVFQAHCYRFEDGLSTFIVECDDESWHRAGFDGADASTTIAICERMFSQWLDGHHLMSNATHRERSPWVNFVRVTNERWFDGNVVLVGDAAHTAHFSIGSGTKLAMEDAISLARAVSSHSSLPSALQTYQDERMIEALRLQNASRNSMEWFENVRRYIHLPPEQFAYSLLTRSQRVSHENLRLRDSAYLSGVERWFAARATAAASRPTTMDTEVAPPMFTPYTLRGMTLANRIAVAPMDMYRSVDGVPGEFHMVHLGARALGGAGLIFTEMVCVSPDARITLGCAGMYTSEHAKAWRRIVDFVHRESDAKICLQLGHSGRRGSTKLPWEASNASLDAGGWETIAPSAIPYTPAMHTPREMTRADMDAVRHDFVRAVRYGIDAGFDMIELHCAHGYLMSSFITPLSNRRNDCYGGSLENRMRFPLEVCTAMRDAWPADRPMSVRISATDWVEGGVDGAESVEIARAFVDAGADIIHVSTGETSIDAQPVYGRMYQTPYSDRIRNEAGVRTIAVGNILDADQVNAIITSGRADICALGRPHLTDPNWTLRAAAELGYAPQRWTPSYYPGRRQLERELEKQRSTG
ncbi:MAG: bifunctional salicylyl-CoA 5-hydroxylase/oxidoreductase [Gemmatimonadota bacterium]